MRFTLFTPVFNRAGTLDRVWRSITQQSCRDFEWICVDDGSTDESHARLQAYRDQADFPVTLLRNPKNQGKHVAWNHAVEQARGELFVPCDSDDEFDSNALDFFWECWSSLTPAERQNTSGINVLCRNATTGKIAGSRFPHSPMWSNNLELSYKWQVAGEKWGCIRIDVLKAHPFPTVKGYYPEGYVWYTIARKYQVLCVNQVLRTYFSDQSNRISLPQVPRMRASYEYTAWHLNTNWDYIAQQTRSALLEGSNLYLFGFFLGEQVGRINAKIRRGPVIGIWPLLCLIGWLRYRRLRRQLPDGGAAQAENPEAVSNVLPARPS